MHRLSIRCLRGKWEVLAPSVDSDFWIRCKSLEDARKLSQSGKLTFEALEGQSKGHEVANELDDVARLFCAYGFHERAAWLAEHAKFARGEPSIFDISHAD